MLSFRLYNGFWTPSFDVVIFAIFAKVCRVFCCFCRDFLLSVVMMLLCRVRMLLKATPSRLCDHCSDNGDNSRRKRQANQDELWHLNNELTAPAINSGRGQIAQVLQYLTLHCLNAVSKLCLTFTIYSKIISPFFRDFAHVFRNGKTVLKSTICCFSFSILNGQMIMRPVMLSECYHQFPLHEGLSKTTFTNKFGTTLFLAHWERWISRTLLDHAMMEKNIDY